MTKIKARSHFVRRNLGKQLSNEPYDEAVVFRIMAGEQIKSNTSDRHEAVRRLLKTGLSGNQIAKRTGLCNRTVSRIKHRR